LRGKFSQIWSQTRYEIKKGKKESFYVLGYLLKLIIKNIAIWIFFSFEIWPIWAIFLMKNPFNRLRSYFSGSNLEEFCQLKKDHP
jgi:hypothetical protein